MINAAFVSLIFSLLFALLAMLRIPSPRIDLHATAFFFLILSLLLGILLPR